MKVVNVYKRARIGSVSHRIEEDVVELVARRIRISTDAPYVDLRSRLDAEAPPLDAEEQADLETGRSDWATFLRGVSWSAPSGFVRLWRYEADALLAPSGSTTLMTTYLLADLATTARAVRQDPAALLYLPTRLELQSRPGGSAIVVEQPSAALASFGRNKLVQAGAELDRRLGDLLEAVGIERPSLLRR